MKAGWAYIIVLVIMCAGLMSCAQLAKVDRNRLNHPAMDFSSRSTPKPPGFLTNMAVDQGGANAGCAVCAH